MLLTGYLMSVKQIPIERSSIKKFYKGLSTIVITYILACVIIFFFRLFIQHDNLMLRDLILSCLRYDGYAWYVKMYIGLYFLIPFLNILWQSAGRKESQLILLVVLLFLTAAPSVFNIWNFHIPGALFRPWITDTYDKLVPDWWKGLLSHYLHYYLGAYVRRNVDAEKTSFRQITVLTIGFTSSLRALQCVEKLQRLLYWGQLVNTRSSKCYQFNTSVSLYQFIPLSPATYMGIKTISPYFKSDIWRLFTLLDSGSNHISCFKCSSKRCVPDRIFNFPIYTGKTVLISLLLSFLIFVLSPLA